MFDTILDLIKDNPVFLNNSNNPQTDTKVQLAVYLNRVSHYGNAVSVPALAEWASISTGSVKNFTHRVMTAILDLHAVAFAPLSDSEIQAAKKWIADRTTPAWSGGYMGVDGSGIGIFRKPAFFGEDYFNRSGDYTIACQFIFVLATLLLVDYVVGDIGSTHDAEAFWNSSIHLTDGRAAFLGKNEWLWADSAYPAETWLVPLTRSQQTSLRELRISINDDKGHDHACLWIQSCLILHNLIIRQNATDLRTDWEAFDEDEVAAVLSTAEN
ncbi:hypothetical protein A0H81_01085, partial [Grifola frondosa]